MKSLFLLIALYTITGKQAVPSGEVPAGASCVYEQSGTKSGQMTAGNDITLTLYGYDRCMIQSVRLMMHSNKSAGAGELQMTIGQTVVWSISDAAFNAPSWAGAYSSDWVDITHDLNNTKVPKNSPVTLHIRASQNSLYLQSVELTYTAAEAEVYTVQFDTHIPQQVAPATEQKPGAGVALPDVPIDDPNWRFYGWARTSCYGSDMPVETYQVGTRFYPEDDCTLHAVYMQGEEQQPWYPTDNLTSGDYMITLYEPVSGTMLVASGSVTNGCIPATAHTLYMDNGWVSMPVEACMQQNIYTLQVIGDTVSILHQATDKPVCLSNSGKLAVTTTNNQWQATPCNADNDAMQHYAISATAGSGTYYISFGLSDDLQYRFQATSDPAYKHDLLLFALADRVETAVRYSSFPFGGDVTNTNTDNSHEYRMNIGVHTLIIKNGKKYVQINE